ncbi:HSP90 family protein [Lysinibacter cavernae]|uniref:Molecular chaperone HtpG n=1 Tax=Lysinibacter cavernae TaxID=1640652 RepID=A0A7X5R3A0_9MICO|nr:HSP90 family protein [Lysinibacter cavernae]NIH54826.1 molecular chaperone HtpG [Lysinibacter cavernae]
MNTVPESATPFQVDLRGVVDLLSRHIYSSPRVFLRELLQNGRDAVSARRREFADAPVGVVQIVPAGLADGTNDFVFRDNGVGLTATEASELLATVGRSSKRDDMLSMNRDDYLGQFGIGLLSCFMVADTITVRSRSARGGAPIEWKGNTNGTFTIRELNDAESANLPIGTEISLNPRDGDSDLLTPSSVLKLAALYGRYLDLAVEVAQPATETPPTDSTPDGVRWVTVNEDPIFSKPFDKPGDELLALGEKLLGQRPFDAIEVVVPSTGTRGTAFVLPFSPRPGSRQSHRAYLGGMLLSETVDDLLPDWAFFVRVVIDTTGLNPTASREQFIASSELEETREAIGAAVRRWIMLLSATKPHLLQEFIQIHSLGLKSLAVHDDELAEAVVNWLTIETSLGHMTINDYLNSYGSLRYTGTVDEFRQLAPIASTDAPIVNGGYIYESELFARLPQFMDGVHTEQVTVADELDNLDVPPLDDRDAVVALEAKATDVLSAVDCRVSVRSFHPSDLSSLYVADPAVLRRMERTKAATIAPGLWSQVVTTVDTIFTAQAGEDASAAAQAQLCLNWNSPLVRKLAELSDSVVFARSIQLLYVQALLAGHRPLSAADRVMLSQSMTDLIQLSVGLDWSDPAEGDFS